MRVYDLIQCDSCLNTGPAGARGGAVVLCVDCAATAHDDHDIHGLIVEVWPDGSTTTDDDCDCLSDCGPCKAAGVVRPESTNR